MSATNLAASIRARLLNHARATCTEFTQVLWRYALERVIYRLYQSVDRDKFLLQGTLLFDLWFDKPHRPTGDAGLLGSGDSDLDAMAAIFREICTLPLKTASTSTPRTFAQRKSARTPDTAAFASRSPACWTAHDAWTMDFEESILCQALTANLARRKTPQPTKPPHCSRTSRCGVNAKLVEWWPPCGHACRRRSHYRSGNPCTVMR